MFKLGANGTRLTGSVAVAVGVDSTSSCCPLGSGGAVAAGTGGVAGGAVAVPVADVVASVASLVSLAAAKMSLPFCQFGFLLSRRRKEAGEVQLRQR